MKKLMLGILGLLFVACNADPTVESPNTNVTRVYDFGVGGGAYKIMVDSIEYVVVTHAYNVAISFHRDMREGSFYR